MYIHTDLATVWRFVLILLTLAENECEDDNGGCEHICRDSQYSYTCECEAGYQLSANGKSCYGMHFPINTVVIA